VVQRILPAKIVARGSRVHVEGDDSAVWEAQAVFHELAALDGEVLEPASVNEIVERIRRGETRIHQEAGTQVQVPGLKRRVQPRSAGQTAYLAQLASSDLTLVSGPAGTGKTFLAVFTGLGMLLRGEIRRMILVRPAVEAGERLGFLPGDIKEKVDPYLRPLFDSLEVLLGSEKLKRRLADGTVEIAPLAYMRGRTLDDAYIILDEAQNSTLEQMKMFLTRLGLQSKTAVTGDLTQIDLPAGTPSGMVDAVERLAHIEGIAVVKMRETDIVRHPLVRKIIAAYHRKGPGGS